MARCCLFASSSVSPTYTDTLTTLHTSKSHARLSGRLYFLAQQRSWTSINRVPPKRVSIGSYTKHYIHAQVIALMDGGCPF